MHFRLVILWALLFVSIYGGYGLRPAHAGFCTVEDIQDGIMQDVPLGDILDVCDELDVNGCDTEEVFFMIREGFTLDDIYYECR